MDQEFNIFNHIEHMRKYSGKWFVRQTRREIILPVSVSVAQHLLQIAFATNITISKGFLFAKYNYTGRVHDNEIDVEFSVRSRSKLRYSMHGQLFPHPKGSLLVMIVKDETPVLFIQAIILAVIFIINRDIGFIIISTIFCLILAFPVLAWHRSSAADNVSDLIYKIVTNQL